jgi:hypothetical protein
MGADRAVEVRALLVLPERMNQSGEIADERR